MDYHVFWEEKGFDSRCETVVEAQSAFNAINKAKKILGKKYINENKCIKFTARKYEGR